MASADAVAKWLAMGGKVEEVARANGRTDKVYVAPSGASAAQFVNFYRAVPCFARGYHFSPWCCRGEDEELEGGPKGAGGRGRGHLSGRPTRFR